MVCTLTACAHYSFVMHCPLFVKFFQAAMESISVEQLTEEMTALLRRCTGDPALRAPVKVTPNNVLYKHTEIMA